MDWKDRLNVVYSTNPDYNYEFREEEKVETLDAGRQQLRVFIEKKNRGGKVVTVVKGFAGSEADMKELSKLLKTRCGTGGSVKDGEIIIQGEVKEKVVGILKEAGYTHTK